MGEVQQSLDRIIGAHQAYGKSIVSLDGTKIWEDASGDRAQPAVVFIHGFLLSGMVPEKQLHGPFLLENRLVAADRKEAKLPRVIRLLFQADISRQRGLMPQLTNPGQC